MAEIYQLPDNNGNSGMPMRSSATEPSSRWKRGRQRRTRNSTRFFQGSMSFSPRRKVESANDFTTMGYLIIEKDGRDKLRDEMRDAMRRSMNMRSGSNSSSHTGGFEQGYREGYREGYEQSFKDHEEWKKQKQEREYQEEQPGQSMYQDFRYSQR